MHYYYDKEGEVILESCQDLYYKMNLMREDSRKDYEKMIANSNSETSKLTKIIENDSKDKLKQN